MATPTTSLLRQSSYPYCGRLFVLETGRTTGYDPFAGLSSFPGINFPAMPDSIELARSVEYLVVNSPVMPDGIHQYKWTNPLTIPFSFKLQSFDKDFCPKGAKSLLELAALLHAMVLPISVSGQATKMDITAAERRPDPKDKDKDKNKNKDKNEPGGSTDDLASRGQDSDVPYNVSSHSKSDFNPPVTLRLELIFTEDTGPGIVCTGYLKDVKVKLNGPWLRGPDRSCNLPTSADFDFTFVHVPGYGNNFSISTSTIEKNSTQAQAFAHDVKDTLYNTRQLSLISERSYQGFSPPPPPPPAPAPPLSLSPVWTPTTIPPSTPLWVPLT